MDTKQTPAPIPKPVPVHPLSTDTKPTPVTKTIPSLFPAPSHSLTTVTKHTPAPKPIPSLLSLAPTATSTPSTIYSDMPPLVTIEIPERPKRHILTASRSQISSVPPRIPPLQSETRSQAQVETSPFVPEAWDGHFHIDHLNYLPQNLSQLQNLVPCDPSYKVNLTGGIVVFCNPSKFPTLSVIRHLSSIGLKVAIGLHPKNASRMTMTQFNDLRALVLSPYVSALGEIGLDTTATPLSQAYQNDVLDRLLPLLQKSIILVLHCRPQVDLHQRDTLVPKADFLIQSLLDRLRLNKIPQRQKVHFHCFTGSPRMAQIWLHSYPKTVFSFTHSCTTNYPETFNSLGNHQFALETDAPHFRFGTRYGGVTGPGQIGMVAGRLSAVCRVDWRELLITSSQNLSNLYL